MHHSFEGMMGEVTAMREDARVIRAGILARMLTLSGRRSRRL